MTTLSFVYNIINSCYNRCRESIINRSSSSLLFVSIFVSYIKCFCLFNCYLILLNDIILSSRNQFYSFTSLIKDSLSSKTFYINKGALLISSSKTFVCSWISEDALFVDSSKAFVSFIYSCIDKSALLVDILKTFIDSRMSRDVLFIKLESYKELCYWSLSSLKSSIVYVNTL